MTALADPVDNWHTPSPSMLLDMASVIEQGLGPASSVSGTVGWACQQVFGTDPFTWVSDQFDGDWRAVSTAADCLDQMGTWMQTVTANAAAHAWSFSMGWEGEAAMAARGQFLELNTTLAPTADQVRECGRAADALATEVYAVATVVSALVESIVAGLAACVSPPTLALAVPKAIDTLLKVIGMITKSLASLQALIDILRGQAASLSALQPTSVGTGYDNPMVR